MIYSASRRTDLVAFYPEVIVERVRRSRKLEAIVFWTKDPRNLLRPDLREILQRIPTVIQLTLTGLGGTEWEPFVPPPFLLRDTLKQVGSLLPRGAIQWRFDPILADATLFPRVEAMYGLLCETIGKPDGVTVSFPDPYRKVVERLRKEGLRLPSLSPQEEQEILRGIVERLKIPVRLCCEPSHLNIPGVEQAHCIDGARFDRLYGTSLACLSKDRGQRETCGCVTSTDIGSYEYICRHACRYCYASPAPCLQEAMVRPQKREDVPPVVARG